MANRACLALAVLLLGVSPLRAADFEWQVVSRGDGDTARGNWRTVGSWKPQAVPATKADRGIVPSGKAITVTGDLGTDGNRPTIVLQPGARMYITGDLRTPIELAGGVIDSNWRGGSIASPIKVTADSTLHADGEEGDGANKVMCGALTNTGPVTLHIEGNQRFTKRCGTAFTGAVSIDSGTLFIYEPLTSEPLGSGPVTVRTGARLCYYEPWRGGDMAWALTNDPSGGGTVQTANPDTDRERRMVTLQGIAIHPAEDGKPATLAFRSAVKCSSTGRGDATKYVRLTIDVVGSGQRAGVDYGQIWIEKRLENSLDNVDLILNISPSLTAQQVRDNHLKIIVAGRGDIGPGTFRPFHTVTVQYGKKAGKATANFCASEDRLGGWVEVSDIVLPAAEAP